MKVWVLRDTPFRAFYQRLGGQLVEQKNITSDGQTLVEEAYGWNLLSTGRGSSDVGPIDIELSGDLGFRTANRAPHLLHAPEGSRLLIR